MPTNGATVKMAALVALLTLSGVLPSAAGDTPNSPSSLLQLRSQGPAIPSEAELVALADRSMRFFMLSVREKSMRTFWNHISLRFQEKFSPEQLDDVFKGFYAVPISGDPLAGKSPVFRAQPTVDANGYLAIEGLYATAPSRLHFQLVFVAEGLGWKVIGINVTLKDAGAPPPASTTPSPTKRVYSDA